jgi:DNA (cytosine-5)-methyltransferase 1
VRELSLFSGAGGGLLASRLLGWQTVGYVEFNDYCQRVLAQRIADGYLERAPIFGDIRAFIAEGYASVYQGMVDVVSGGFPCQPFSVAGKQAAADDPRNMWPQTREVIRLVRPRFAFLENVPGLLAESHGYFGTILCDLAELGYDVRWTVLSAADCGAPHLRKRLWILADSGENRRGLFSDDSEVSSENRAPTTYNNRVDPHPWKEIPAPEFCGVANGVAEWMGASWTAAGNGQVPIVAATAWRLLMRDTSRFEALCVLRGEIEHWRSVGGEREVAALQRAIDVLSGGLKPSASAPSAHPPADPFLEGLDL